MVVDDDENVRDYLSALLHARGYEVSACASADAALKRLSGGDEPVAVLLDLVMPGMDGLALLARIRQSHPAVPVIIVSTLGQAKTVVEAMRKGADDYLTKPFEEPELDLTLERVLEKERLRDEVRALRKRLDQRNGGELLSANPRMQRLREVARQVAETDAPVLILGETGVGKDVVARYLHEQSPRRDEPFVRVNCAALPQELLESELFGYERGAFSGALQEKPGKFEQAGRGTILLDEIAEMTPHLQAKLLHVLQDGEYTRLGGRRALRAEARVVAATNQPIDTLVRDGRFREDLYFRLNVVRLELPPLRERPEDIPVLAEHFLQMYAARYRGAPEGLPPRLLQGFVEHSWPGNVRELENAVRRPDLAAALTELRGTQRPPTAPPEPPSEPGPRRPPARDGQPLSLKRVGASAADRAERELVLKVLEETHWNRKQASRRLHISYKALLNKLKKWQAEEQPPRD
jgi:two-component system response regulator AtoC